MGKSDNDGEVFQSSTFQNITETKARERKNYQTASNCNAISLFELEQNGY